MIELIYPYDIAPAIPPPNVGTALVRPDVEEWFPVVEPNGLVIGRSSRKHCHSGAKVLHPVVHLHVIDRYSRIYLQRRPLTKDIQPGKWDTAVGGHVSYGEAITEALYREASEELGLSAFNPIYLESYEYESPVEREMVNIFAAVGHYDLHPDPEEVEEGRWWELADIDASIGKGVFTPNFESEFDMIRSKLLALL